MKKLVAISVIFLIGIIFLVGIGGYLTNAPVDAQDISVHSIIVTKGETVASIAKGLVDAHLIKSDLMLKLVLKTQGSNATIETGNYDLSPSMSTSQVVDTLLKGSTELRVTLKEGLRSEEFADELSNVFGLRYFDPNQFTTLTKGQEGTLFPDTYFFAKQTNAQTIVTTMEANFEKHYQKAVSDVGAPVLSREQTIILASLVEREAKDPTGMKMVAGILMNRIAAGIPLQVDSTLQYVRGYDSKTKTWWPAPRASDKSLDSLFNTYANRGLPPAPICNPGLDALEAAIAPTKSDYLYYISDHQGKMHYATTLAEHNANIDLYLK